MHQVLLYAHAGACTSLDNTVQVPLFGCYAKLSSRPIESLYSVDCPATTERQQRTVVLQSVKPCQTTFCVRYHVRPQSANPRRRYTRHHGSRLTSIRRAPKHRSDTFELGQPQLRLISSKDHCSHISATSARVPGSFPPSCTAKGPSAAACPRKFHRLSCWCNRVLSTYISV